jgi:hypothetical protein
MASLVYRALLPGLPLGFQLYVKGLGLTRFRTFSSLFCPLASRKRYSLADAAAQGSMLELADHASHYHRRGQKGT